MAIADVVIIHWWNHPLLFNFLVKNQFPDVRIALWSHISGFTLPNVFTKKLLLFPDIFVFTTPLSLKCSEVISTQSHEKFNYNIIWSTGGVKRFSKAVPVVHPGFNIGYVGTVDYSKMHQECFSICSKINIPDVQFIFCGELGRGAVVSDVKQYSGKEHFIFEGLVEDSVEFYQKFDVFGYPLAKHHYGTCDQVLAEAMAVGVVPVVMNNPMERLMVQHEVTGIIAINKNDYIFQIERLYKDPCLRKKLSENVKQYASKRFSLTTMVAEWDQVIEALLLHSKKSRKWELDKEVSGLSQIDVYLEAMGNRKEAQYFKDYNMATSDTEKNKCIRKIKKECSTGNWQSSTKGTLHHYQLFFPEDKSLLQIQTDLTTKET